MHSQRVALCSSDGLIIVSKASFRSMLNVYMSYDVVDLQLELASNNYKMFWYYDLQGLNVSFGETMFRDDVVRDDMWRIVDKYRSGFGYENFDPVPISHCVSNGFSAVEQYRDYYVVWSTGTFKETLRDVIFAGRYPLETDDKVLHNGIEEGKVLLTYMFTECDIDRLRDTVYTKDHTGDYMNSTKPLLT